MNQQRHDNGDGSSTGPSLRTLHRKPSALTEEEKGQLVSYGVGYHTGVAYPFTYGVGYHTGVAYPLTGVYAYPTESGRSQLKIHRLAFQRPTGPDNTPTSADWLSSVPQDRCAPMYFSLSWDSVQSRPPYPQESAPPTVKGVRAQRLLSPAYPLLGVSLPRCMAESAIPLRVAYPESLSRRSRYPMLSSWT